MIEDASKCTAEDKSGRILNDTPKRYDFMFYETYRDAIERIKKLYSEDEAGIFCLELIRYGVRRKRIVDMRPELEATMRSIYPLLEKSQEHKERAAERMKQADGYKKRSSASASTKQDARVDRNLADSPKN